MSLSTSQRLAFAALLLVAAIGQGARGDEPAGGANVGPAPAAATPSSGLTFTEFADRTGLSTAVDVILDPLAPNWRIEQSAVSENTYSLALKMKRFRAGGDGEARQVFHRRAADLALRQGYAGYDVLRYEESLESAILGSQRTAKGAIRLTGKAAAPVAGIE